MLHRVVSTLIFLMALVFVIPSTATAQCDVFVTNVCAGQSVCASPTAGTPPYFYFWSNGATTQCITPAAGIYTVTITDVNGCTGTGSGTVFEAPFVSVTDVCRGVSLCASPSGGQAPYFYSWSNGATTQCITPAAGIYTVTITDSNGCTGTSSDAVSLISCFKIRWIVDLLNDQGRFVRLTFGPHPNDADGVQVPVLGYAIYRRIDQLPSAPGITVAPAGRSSAIPMVERDHLLSPQMRGWDYVTTVPAFGDDEYSTVVPTLADSTITAGMHWSVFMYRATTAVPTTFFDSPPDSGYSLDNLAPTAPKNLAMSGPVLSWDESSDADFNYFSIYGSGSPVFDPSAVLITSTTEASADVSSEPYIHFHVTATDFSGNEGEASSTMSQVGVGGTPKPAFGLAAFPNPFRLSTRVSYSVAAESLVRLVVYDVRGRRVSTLVDGEVKGEGTYELRYEPAMRGVYFMHLQVGSEMVSKKVVVLE